MKSKFILSSKLIMFINVLIKFLIVLKFMHPAILVSLFRELLTLLELTLQMKTRIAFY